MILNDSPFLRACRREASDYTPIWLMRQAGRFMPEYRAIRERHSMLETITTPELAAQVTLLPVDRFGMDAAIIFADILPPLIGMGLKLDFEHGVGPVIQNPIQRPYDIDLLGTPPAEATMPGTLQAIRLVVAELSPRGIPLIGFAGAPFTLASYAIEGGSSRTLAKTKSLMYSEPAAWKRLMLKLVTVQADYLLAQAKAGATALQIFDSWAGSLGKEDYIRYIQPYNRMLLQMVERSVLPLNNAPIINFSTGTSAYIEEVAACGGQVIGVDWQLPLDVAWQKIGYERAIQGNLDPITLLAPWRELQPRVDHLLAQAAGRSGHIFNLGHGVLPNTPPETVKRLVAYVHEQSNVERRA